MNYFLKMFCTLLIPFLTFFEPILAYSQTSDPLVTTLRTSYQTIFTHLLRRDIDPGAVIASPSQDKPNYFYHWVRDAGLTMLEMVELYQLPLPAERKEFIESLIQNWINFELRNQKTALAHSNLGEPIFTVDGAIYPYPWGRPQNDGPAIRALAMTRYAMELIKQNRKTEAKRLYSPELPAESPIKRDLEYVSVHWQDPNFDLWEEVNGDHFFTRMAQRAALIEGAKLALQLQDPLAADYYTQKSHLIEEQILNHFNSKKNYIVPTLNIIGDNKNKISELDSSVILAILYFTTDDGFISVDQPFVESTAQKLEETFTSLYRINSFNYTHDDSLAPAMGRYPEDVYDGVGFSEGNPWFIATNAFAEYYCLRAAKEPSESRAKILRERANSFLQRTLLHASRDGHMSEQFHRYSGYMQGAKDLTWSYVSFIRAYRSCSSTTHFSDVVMKSILK